MTLPCACARYKTLRVYEVMTDSAASLVEYARKAAPAPAFEVIDAIGSSLTSIQQAGHPSARDPAVHHAPADRW